MTPNSPREIAQRFAEAKVFELGRPGTGEIRTMARALVEIGAILDAAREPAVDCEPLRRILDGGSTAEEPTKAPEKGCCAAQSPIYKGDPGPVFCEREAGHRGQHYQSHPSVASYPYDYPRAWPAQEGQGT